MMARMVKKRQNTYQTDISFTFIVYDGEGFLVGSCLEADESF